METRIAMLPMMVLLLLAILVVIVLVKLFSKHGKVAATIVLAVLVTLGVSLVFVRVSHQRPAAIYHEQQLALPGRHEPGIWTPGIENEFEANIYPSRASAIRSLGLRIGRPLLDIFGSREWPKKGIVFKGNHDQILLEEFVKTANRTIPNIQFIVKPEGAAVGSGEIGITLDLSILNTERPSWSISQVTNGTYQANVIYDNGNRRRSINAEFVEKPWIENFYGNWNSQPNKRFIVAKSAESCLTGQEAEQQAMINACNQLAVLLKRTSHAKATPSLTRKVTQNDLREYDFIVNRFSQKFKGSTSDIWRHALLIDASPAKMEEFAMRKVVATSRMRESWARMIASIVGLLALITVAYVFLNAATKGYYTWALRITGAILAVLTIIFFIA